MSVSPMHLQCYVAFSPLHVISPNGAVRSLSSGPKPSTSQSGHLEKDGLLSVCKTSKQEQTHLLWEPFLSCRHSASSSWMQNEDSVTSFNSQYFNKYLCCLLEFKQREQRTGTSQSAKKKQNHSGKDHKLRAIVSSSKTARRLGKNWEGPGHSHEVSRETADMQREKVPVVSSSFWIHSYLKFLFTSSDSSNIWAH